jgi:beta-lactam-binding protein with PASTA domain
MDLKSTPVLKHFTRKSFYIKLGIYIAGFIVFILLMNYIIMPWYTKHGQEYELPDVTDKEMDEAVEILDEEGFNPIIQDSVYDEKFPQGVIIQQNPLPFSRVKKGRRVYLVLSIGEKPRFVPQLIGLTPQDADFRLKEEGLRLNQTFYEFSDFYPRGVVINQSIPSGERVDRNQKINITVSLGQAPTSQEIPNLVGKSLESAKGELEAVGVKVGQVRYTFRGNLVPGTVLRQSIPPGHSIMNVDSINLIISTDEPPEEEITSDSLSQ